MTPPKAAEPSDEELVRRVCEGDEAAATTLFGRHVDALRAAARARIPAPLRERIRESDVVQETYAAAFRAASRFQDRGEGSFVRWLQGILAKKVAGEVRRLARLRRDARREVRLVTGVEPPAKNGRSEPAPDSRAAAEERARVVHVIIEGLPRDQRTVIRLVHFEGLTLAEAGRRLGRSADAARMLYARALDRLGERLAARRRSLS